MVVLFSYQLYCDFSGYSDIALGAAMMFGYDLSENFNRPFSSKTFAEFWRRWHISLSNWLRDYLYYPLALGWGKVSKVKLYISLLITFFLIGLWHGPNWTFAVFGVLNGMYLVIETATEKMRKRVVAVFGLHSVPVLHKAIQTLIVFTGMTISFIFFRSETITQAITILKSIGSVDNMNTTVSYLIHTLTKPVGTVVFLVVIGSILILEGVQYLQTKKNTFYIFDLLPNVYRYMWYYALVVGIIMFGYFGAQTFIYFQF
jgi:D-alanyl-lipoteichoic acid acyltransferase DltB (MBOAT superfamily)